MDRKLMVPGLYLHDLLVFEWNLSLLLLHNMKPAITQNTLFINLCTLKGKCIMLMKMPTFSFILHWWLPFAYLVICLNWQKLGSVSSRPTFGNETDKLVLLAFKKYMVDIPNGVLSSWNDSMHFCQWQGVTCSLRHQRVTSLKLEGQGLVGSLPSIGNLTFLKELILSNNNLGGSIPKDIGHLQQLKFLNLSMNSVEGEIPVELTNCSNLRYMDLSVNNLTGQIPPSVGYISKLLYLWLYKNSLTGGIPFAVGNLSSLESLSFAFNHLEGKIPHELGRSKSLMYLYFTSNNLSGMIPPSLYNLSSLIEFGVASNRLSGNFMSDNRFSFPNLDNLELDGNEFTGIIPDKLSNISGLQYLDVSNNYLTGKVPDTLGMLKHLIWLNVELNLLGYGKSGDLNFLNFLTNISTLNSISIFSNNFGGGLPNSISNFTIQLQYIYLGNNQISGNIPEGIENLINLNMFAANLNYLTGVVPPSIGKLQNLNILLLESNRLSGLLPSSLGNLSQLFELYLDNNNLEGTIPTSLRNCQKIQVLLLGQNMLSGSITEDLIGCFNHLRLLYLENNSFTGSLPAVVGNLKNLEELVISDNKLSGKIPSELGNCFVLEHLDMARNFFEGSIPVSFSSLRGIRFLNLSSNNLSGKIPKELERLPGLLSLNLSFNHLEGKVPRGGVFKKVSAISITGNKKLCGGIPQLQLPPCSNVQLGKHDKGKHLSVKIIIAITVASVWCLAFMVASVLLYRRKKTTLKASSSTSLGYGYLRVSYKDLLKATGGFASCNLIGMGGFGSVYKGILGQDERPVGVKVLNLHQHGASKSFEAECKVLRKIQHRNLLKVITSCSSLDSKGNEFKALVFEFMANGNLDSWLHQESRNLSFRQRLDIAIDVANAVDYLHHHCHTPIVHGDLKPSNVLLDENMVAHVGDFGLAKLLPEASEILSSDSTSSALIIGSIGYVAPEYGIGGSVSAQGDVYSYGILLLEMFTGKRPKDGMFSDGLSLHDFCKMALPKRVMEITDSKLLGELHEEINEVENFCDMEDERHHCLVSIVRIGVACSEGSPFDRMDMNTVIMELNVIKEVFLGMGIHGERQLKMQIA